MTTRILSRRLELLEATFLPADTGVTEHTINFVEADGTITDSLVLKHSGATPARGGPPKIGRERFKP